MADETKPEEIAPTPNPEVLARFSHLVGDMRSSIARDFPKLAPNIYIVDPTKPIDEEIARASEQLRIPNLRERISRQNDGRGTGLLTPAGQENTGAATATMMRDDPEDKHSDLHTDETYENGMNATFNYSNFDAMHDVAIVFPSYPANLAAIENVSGNDFYKLVESLMHETGHAVSVISPEFKHAVLKLSTNGIINKNQYYQLAETLATTFAYDVGSRNSLLPQSYINRSLAYLDSELRDQRMLMYNATDEFESIRRDYPKEGFPAHNGFNDLNGSFTRALNAQTLNLTPEQIAAAVAIGKAREAADFENQPKRGMAAYDKILPEIRKIMPFSERINAAQDYYYGQASGEYHPTPTPPIDALRTAASFAMLDRQGNADGITDSSAEKFVSSLLRSYVESQKQHGNETSITPEMIDSIAKHTENKIWAQELLAGTDIVTALRGGIASIQNSTASGAHPPRTVTNETPTPTTKR